MARNGPFGRPARTANASSEVHPTRQKLIDTVLHLLENNSPAAITADMILEASGVSKGSLYHHFEDLTDLLEMAMLARFARGVDESVRALSAVVSLARSREDVLQGLEEVARAAHVRERTRHRATRVQMISLATMNPRFAAKLSGEQERLTDALTAVFQEGQDKGLMNRAFDARAASVLIQAFTLGKIVDEIVEHPMDPDAWNQIISRLIRLVFGGQPKESKATPPLPSS